MTRRRLLAAVALLASACASDPRRGADSRPAGPPLPVAFEGAFETPQQDLLEAAKRELDAFHRNTRAPGDLDDAAASMRRRLRERGRGHALVAFRIEPSEDAPERVVFEVSEGPLTRLAGVCVQGATAAPPERLRPLWELGAERDADGAPTPFRRSRVDQAIAELEAWYLSEGYYRARVGPAEVAWNDARDAAHVTVPVVEGRRYVVASVETRIEPDDLPSAPAILRETEAYVGTPYAPDTPRRIAATVRRRLAAEGRLDMRVFARGRTDDETGDVAVAVRVRPGPQLYVENAAVHGDDRTRTDFILERAALQHGALLTQDRLDDAVDALYGTGLFRSVRVERTPLPEGTSAEQAVDVDVHVEELDARLLDLEVGFGTYEKLRAAVRYRDRNLFGRGRTFEAVPSASLRSAGLDLNLFDPYLLDDGWTVEAIAGFQYRQEPSFDSLTARIEVAARKRLGKESSFRLGQRMRWSDASQLEVVGVDPAAEGSAFSSGPFVEVEYDSRDDVFLPTRGVYASGGAWLSTPVVGGELHFLETRLAASTYLALGEGTVLALGGRARNREILDDRATLPIQERFFLGGENSVRAFYESELGPSDAQGRPIGGLSSLEAFVELRQRLVGDLHAAVFYDVGVVGADSFGVTGPFGHAIGAG
ncbi:MAG TPA: BamA/TamA family outer membrane protein, partial [Planctomycetota bacterium]|nr:BamA/TamA family outer membrane protein [Planctomycetota bacterium]